MREEESNWFSKWEDELPSPNELMPLSQSLISPDLALAFDIPIMGGGGSNMEGQQTMGMTPLSDLGLPSCVFDICGGGGGNSVGYSHAAKSNSLSLSSPRGVGGSVGLGMHPQPAPSMTPSMTPLSPPEPNSSEFDSGDLGGGGGGNGDEPARTLKRPRLVWTPQLHKRFVDAVGHLGIKNAVPKTIMQLMSVEGLTRENVASHLQKYRLYLKRMQGLSNGGGSGGGIGSVGDSATDHLFASAPVPHHFLHPGSGIGGGGGGGGGRSGGNEQYLPFIPVAAALEHHRQQQLAAAAAVAAVQQQQQQYIHRQQVAQFGSPPGVHGQQFEHGFLTRPVHRMATPSVTHLSSFGEELDVGGGGGGGRKVLTLFPTGDN